LNKVRAAGKKNEQANQLTNASQRRVQSNGYVKQLLNTITSRRYNSERIVMDNKLIQLFIYEDSNGNLAIPRELMLLFFGGTWPKSEEYGYPPGFNWESIDEFILDPHLRQFTPYSGGIPAPGPDLKIDVVPNPLSRVLIENCDLF
jgi:hypothetical protein